MQISDLFRRKSPPKPEAPPKLDDPYFGRIHLIGSTHRGQCSHWGGTKYFEPILQNVDFVIGAGPDGPTQAQRDLFQQMESQYPRLLGQFEKVFVGDGEPFTNDKSLRDLFQSLQLLAIELPCVSDMLTRWELLYTTELDEDHIIRVAFRDWELQEYGHDG